MPMFLLKRAKKNNNAHTGRREKNRETDASRLGYRNRIGMGKNSRSRNSQQQQEKRTQKTATHTDTSEENKRSKHYMPSHLRLFKS